MNTRSRSASPASTDHAFAAPVFACTSGPRQSSYAGSVLAWGTGSQDHLSAPVRASYARTSPLGRSGLVLSATDDPVITRPLTTRGGDVTEYAAGSKGAIRRPIFRSTMPC